MKYLFLDSRGQVAQGLMRVIFITALRELNGVTLDAEQELFLTSLYIQLFCNNYLRGRIGAMLNRSALGKDRVTPLAPYYPYMHTLTRHYQNRMYRVNIFASDTYFDCLFFINEDN